MPAPACDKGNNACHCKGGANHIEQARPRRVAEMMEQQNRSEAKPGDRQYVPDEANRLPGEMIIAEKLGERLPEKPNQNVLLSEVGMDKTYTDREYGSGKHHLMK